VRVLTKIRLADRLADLGRVACLLPLVYAAACGSINAVEDDAGTPGTAGTSGDGGTTGAAATSGGAGTSGAAGAGNAPGGRGGSVATAGTGGAGAVGGNAAGGSTQKDGGGTVDAAMLDCMPGERTCEMNTPLTCDANGNWQRGTPCSNICSAGSCVGVCTPGAKMCVGNIPQICDNQGLWQAAPACMFVCRQGDCTGVCQPGARQCSSAGMPQSCNADGTWETGQACPFVCSQGVCGGVCKPGMGNCSNNAPQTCTAAGEWLTGQPCQFVCSNGSCAGSCTPGTRQCSNNVPQTCTSTGAWQSGTACPYVCAGGMCGGSCAPNSTRCNNGQKQICDGQGNWLDTTTPSMQLLMNPGFDQGMVAWVESTISSSTIITADSVLTTIKAQSPSNLAWLGGYSNAQDDLSQVVAIPAGASSITLSFYYAIATQENSLAIADTMNVYTYDPAAAKYTAVATFNDNMATPTWTRFSVSLPVSLAGKSIQIGFQATTDNARNTNFWVDSVALDVVACGS